MPKTLPHGLEPAKYVYKHGGYGKLSKKELGGTFIIVSFIIMTGLKILKMNTFEINTLNFLKRFQVYRFCPSLQYVS
jgi:hypothetical protein